MTVAASNVSAETRPLPLRRRLDLELREVQFGGTRYWHVKDPISLRYYQLKPEEHAVLVLLDGAVSLQEIRCRFEEQFAPQRLAPSQLQSFLVMLHSAGLIVADSAAQSEFVVRRQTAEQRLRWLSALSSLLSIRLPGIDPGRFLKWLTPRVGGLFSRVGARLGITWIVLTCLVAGLQLDALLTRLPRFHEFFSGTNLLYLAATLSLTKIVHELGHAVACRKFGADCPEMGLMLLVGTPCLYCNVSDSWMLPNRWHRIVISAAGMYVELILAATCWWLWWFSLPSFFNSLCLNVVIVCSVTTLLFNGNPLLRYDGYYILADVLEIPNLRQQAATLVGNWVSQWFLGADVASQRLMPDRRQLFLASWHIAGAAYRLVMLWGILWFVSTVLEPYGLAPLAAALAAISVVGLVLPPLVQAVSLLRNPFWTRTVNWSRFCIRSLFVGAVATFAVAVPLPHRVHTPAVIQVENSVHVFVQQRGRLKSSVSINDMVKAGDVLAVFENSELEREVAQLTGEVSVIEQQVRSLEARRVREKDTVDQLIPTAQERLAKKRDELTQRLADADRLTIRAPADGRVVPAPSRPATPQYAASSSVRDLTLETWTGTPLDEVNRGITLDAGTELCEIAPSERCEAVVAIDQNDVEFVSVGQTVILQLDHVPESHITGEIIEIAEVDLSVASRELIEHPDFPTRMGADGVVRPVSTAYQARIRLDGGTSLLIRGTGRARIETAPQSLAARLLRFIHQTFRLRTN